MLKSFVSFSRALVIVAALALVPAAAKAQSLGSSTSSAPGSFEAYRAMAITAGVIGGAVVATIVTDGIILPVLGTASGGAGGNGVAGFAGQLISASGTVFGAVAGGLYANDWYGKQ